MADQRDTGRKISEQNLVQSSLIALVLISISLLIYDFIVPKSTIFHDFCSISDTRNCIVKYMFLKFIMVFITGLVVHYSWISFINRKGDISLPVKAIKWMKDVFSIAILVGLLNLVRVAFAFSNESIDSVTPNMIPVVLYRLDAGLISIPFMIFGLLGLIKMNALHPLEEFKERS